MKSFNGRILSILVILVLISAAWAVTKESAENEDLALNSSKLFVSNEQGIEINQKAIENSMSLYQNLSVDKKNAIKDRMIQLTQKRQKNIEDVEKKIHEYKLQKKLQDAKSQLTQINQLLAIQKIALKENAAETAKSLETLISLHENKQSFKPLEDNKLEVE